MLRDGAAFLSTGQLRTTFLDDVTPVPATAVFRSGFAYTQDGRLYVALWPGSGVVFYIGGIAVRGDGACCVKAAGVADTSRGPIPVSTRGEIIASTTAPDTWRDGFSFLKTGAMCMEAIS